MIRFCKDIGMFTIDRGRESCVHRTDFCSDHCYNNKFYRMNHKMIERDRKNELFWAELSEDTLQKVLDRRRLGTDRIRFCSRGEAFANLSDVRKVFRIANATPHRKFYVPTRAWRNTELRRIIERDLPNTPNLFVTASIDPDTSTKEFRSLVRSGWSTGFFGNDRKHPFAGVLGVRITRCPAKWGQNVICADCNVACFTSKQTHHWLKEH